MMAVRACAPWVCVLVAFVLSGCGPSWKSFESADAGYRVEFPGEPQLSSDSGGPAGGSSHSAMVLTSEGSFHVSVFVGENASSETPQARLDAYRQMQADRDAIELFGVTEGELGGVPYYELSYSERDRLCRTRAYACDQRLITVTVMGPLGKQDGFTTSPAAQRFLDSFQIMGGETPAAPSTASN